MKRFFVVLCIAVIILSGGYLYTYFTQDPEDSNVVAEGNSYTLEWKEYPGVAEYDLYIDGALVKTVSTTKTEITEYLIADKEYDIVIKALSVEDGEVTVYEETYDYKAETKSDFERKTFFMNGKVYDYNIESLAEYEIFVWYNILYRNNSARFYNSCSAINIANVNRLTYEYISSYPEYDGIESKSKYAEKLTNTIYTIKNFEYYLPKDFTLSVANCTVDDNSGLYNYKQDKTQATKATVYNMPYEAAATPSTRTFPIDDESMLRVNVYNTEQLFMAVQYGARPIFPKANSVAETVYNNARNVLKEINNSDSLTDYQKVLNIYRYICMNINYDNILFDYMSEIRNFEITSFGMFSPFYLEGAFYDMDNQVAVCDGLAKAFALMCRIEGIEATKVNGSTSGGEHAWNKVKLGSNYHLVDTTWGTASYTSGTERQEALSHKYFLVGDTDIYVGKGGDQTHRPTFEANSYEAINYGYYNDASIHGYSAYVTSKSQYLNIRDAVLQAEEYFFEIQFSDDFAASLVAEYGSVTAFMRSYTYANSIYGSITYYITLSETEYLIQVSPTKTT